ncbi:MAG: plasmid maintenance system killer [Chloroflexi bacterium]|nr:plasmid maintenance system killer [Chloroflexota bacterium]
MRFQFKKRRLQVLYTEGKGAHKYPAGVVAAFSEVMAIIESASDQQELRAFKSLHFEQLKGARRGECSLRLNDQYRLTLVLEEGPGSTSATILDIEDYH